MAQLALFDFDKTIISKDTSFDYVAFALKRNPLRVVVACLFVPFAMLLFLSNKSRFIGNSVFLWTATVGLTPQQICTLRNDFLNQYLHSAQVTVYQNAIDEINLHLANNVTVVIITGSFEGLITEILKRIHLSHLPVLCSSEQRKFGGMVSNFHCFSSNKLKRIHSHYDLSSFTHIIGYSDSAADIPMLSVCDQKYIINPSKSSLKKIHNAFNNNIKVLNWH